LNLLKSVYLRLKKLVVQRIAVIEFEENDAGSDGGDGAGVSKIKLRAF